MIGNKIQDGTGSKVMVKVTEDNRFCTDTVSRSQLEFACLTGNAYNVSTGAITLTNASESAIGYLEYTGENIVIIKEILIILGESTNGTGSGTVKIYKNPTGGTIVSNAVPLSTAENRDFSSAKTISGVLYKGAEGNTLTGGSTFAVTSRSDFSLPISFDAAPIVLRKGNTLGITYTPPSGNTSQAIIAAGTIYIETTNIR